MGFTDDQISRVARLLLPTTVYQLRQRGVYEHKQSQLRSQAGRYYTGINNPNSVACESSITYGPPPSPLLARLLFCHIAGAISLDTPCAICNLDLMHHRTAHMDVVSTWPEYVMRDCGHMFHTACLFAFLSEKTKAVECEKCAGIQALMLNVFEGDNGALWKALDRVLTDEDTWGLEDKLADTKIESQLPVGGVAVSGGYMDWMGDRSER